jgi:phosphoadenosine phosphosulfate reductase
MYIFMKNAPYNVWYERGLDRIGCFLCPASDLSEMQAMRERSGRYEKWDSYVDAYAKSRGLPSEWPQFALWRWKKHPQSVKDEVSNVTGKEFNTLIKQTVRGDGA